MNNNAGEYATLNSDSIGANETASWAKPGAEVADGLGVDPAKGLSVSEISRRQEKFGANQLREHKKKSAWQILINQLKSLIVLLLAAAFFSFI